MKTSLFALILLLFVHVAAVPGKKTDSGASNRTATLASVFWPQDSTVKVYFVRGLFTPEQRQTLWRTLETWTQKVEATSTIRFLYAGETGGLIDCLGCLTLTRQEVYTNDHKPQVSFNLLRGDQTGQLISAWIGFDSAITDSQKLGRLLVQMLGSLSAEPVLKHTRRSFLPWAVFPMSHFASNGSRAEEPSSMTENRTETRFDICRTARWQGSAATS